MKARIWLFAAAMSITGLALAQTNPGVTQITDPAKIAEIERHAEQLRSGAPATPMMDERRDRREHGMRQDGRRHEGRRHHMHRKHHKAMHRRAMKEKAPSDTPMATESKG